MEMNFSKKGMLHRTYLAEYSEAYVEFERAKASYKAIVNVYEHLLNEYTENKHQKDNLESEKKIYSDLLTDYMYKLNCPGECTTRQEAQNCNAAQKNLIVAVKNFYKKKIKIIKAKEQLDVSKTTLDNTRKTLEELDKKFDIQRNSELIKYIPPKEEIAMLKNHIIKIELDKFLIPDITKLIVMYCY